MNNIIWCVNIFHLAWPTSPPYLVKVRCSKLLHNDEMYYSHQTIRRRIKLKYGLFSRVINCHDSSAQKFQNSCSKCAPRTLTPALRRRRVSRVSRSKKATVLCSRCAVLLKHKKLVLGQPVHVWQWSLSRKVVATV